MEYAKEYASALSPRTLISHAERSFYKLGFVIVVVLLCTTPRTVSSVGSSISRRVLFSPEVQPRPFRVCTHDRGRRKGMVASSLDNLLAKAVQAFLLTSEVITLVLEEDGTVVENEEFFQSLETNTQFMLLEGGQRWTPAKGAPGLKRSKKNGIAKFSFDLYKLNPKDFIGCLTIKAIFYDTYTMSYDIKCTGAKQVLKIALRYLSYLARVAGQLLLYSASYVYQRIGEEEQTGTSGTW